MNTPHVVNGAQFKKMLMKAGHTSGYISTGMKKQLQQMKLHNGASASKVLYDKGMHVERHDANKIIQKMKEEGLARGVVGHAEEFVRKGYKAAHEDTGQTNKALPAIDVAKQNRIKQQNLAMHAKSVEGEKAKELTAQQTPNATAKKTIAPVKLATAIISNIGSRPESVSTTVKTVPTDGLGHTLTAASSATGTAPQIKAGNDNLTQEREEELIDMAID